MKTSTPCAVSGWARYMPPWSTPRSTPCAWRDGFPGGCPCPCEPSQRLPPNADHRPPLRSSLLTLQSSWGSRQDDCKVMPFIGVCSSGCLFKLPVVQQPYRERFVIHFAIVLGVQEFQVCARLGGGIMEPDALSHGYKSIAIRTRHSRCAVPRSKTHPRQPAPYLQHPDTRGSSSHGARERSDNGGHLRACSARFRRRGGSDHEESACRSVCKMFAKRGFGG